MAREGKEAKMQRLGSSDENTTRAEAPTRTPERTGLWPWQQCNNIRDGKRCGSWNTEQRSTQTEQMENGTTAVVRYRYCYACNKTYKDTEVIPTAPPRQK